MSLKAKNSLKRQSFYLKYLLNSIYIDKRYKNS